MRLRLAFALLALAAVVAILPAADAQMPAPLFTLKVDVPSGAIAPGNMTDFTFSATRVCPSAADVLASQNAEIQFRTADDDVLVTGPHEMLFEQQVCAQQMRQEQSVKLQVVVSRLANQSIVPVVAKFAAPPSGPTTSSGPEQSVEFTVSVAVPIAVASVPTPAQAAPGLAPLALIGAVAACAGVARLARRK